MNKKIMLMLLTFIIFIPRIYAFSYNISVDTEDTSVSTGTIQLVNVYLKNIEDSNGGIVYCDFEVHTTGGVEIKDSVDSGSNWKMSNNGFYIFEAVKPVIVDSRLFSAKLNINASGSFNIIDIKCQNKDNLVLSISDISTKFKVHNGTSSNDEDELLLKSISDIKLSDGKIKFDPNIKEYTVKVSSFEDLIVTPVVKDDTIRYSVNKETIDDSNFVYVDFIGVDGSNYVYTLNVVEQNEILFGSNNYFLLFLLGLIIIVVLIFLLIKKENR